METNRTSDENRAHNTVTITKTANYIGDYDVVVCGAGPAGWTAATAAARAGAKTAIIDRYGFFGGAASGGLVIPISGFFKHGKRLVGGIPWEFVEALERVNGAIVEYPRGHVSVDTEYYKLIAQHFVLDAGVDIYMNSYIIGADTDAENRIETVYFQNKNGTEAIGGKYFIDATGDADLTAFAGLEYKLGREEDGLCQPMTLNFRLTNVDWSRYDYAKANKLYKEFREKGLIKNPREDILVFKYPIYNIMHLNTTRIVGKHPVSVEDLTESEMIAREQVYEMYQFMKNNIEGMENCDIVSSASEIGIRESRRIVGHYVITKEDVTGAVKHDDRIARATYEIDIHNPAGTGTYHCPVPENDYYTIPYRALIPVGADNLIVAGRPISSTHEAHSSFRIMPITSCIGEAAGAAAAIMKKLDCKSIDVPMKQLQDTLVDYGALI